MWPGDMVGSGEGMKYPFFPPTMPSGRSGAGVEGGQARLCRAGSAIKHSKKQGLRANLSTTQRLD
jgi:hypothetical protein